MIGPAPSGATASPTEPASRDSREAKLAPAPAGTVDAYEAGLLLVAAGSETTAGRLRAVVVVLTAGALITTRLTTMLVGVLWSDSAITSAPIPAPTTNTARTSKELRTGGMRDSIQLPQ